MKLASIFPETMGYYFSKVLEGTHSQDAAHHEFGKLHVELILDKYDKFRRELEDRGEIRAKDYLSYEIDEILYPLNKLKDFFAQPDKSNLTPRDAAIFAEFARDRHDKMLEIANEIDEEYQEKNEPRH